MAAEPMTAVKKGDEKAIRGRTYPAPRPTMWAVYCCVRHAGLPFLGLLFVLDLILALIFYYGFERCYGVLCLL